MYNKSIVLPKVDIAKAVYAAVEESMPDDGDAFYGILETIEATLTSELVLELENAVNQRVAHALENGFMAGWAARGQV